MMAILDVVQAGTEGIPVMDIIIIGTNLLLIVVMCILIHKITAMRKQMTKITDSVEAYLKSIILSEEQEQINNASMLAHRRQEEQSRLINSVLEGIFP